jgi:hypothetical protein
MVSIPNPPIQNSEEPKIERYAKIRHPSIAYEAIVEDFICTD